MRRPHRCLTDRFPTDLNSCSQRCCHIPGAAAGPKGVTRATLLHGPLGFALATSCLSPPYGSCAAGPGGGSLWAVGWNRSSPESAVKAPRSSGAGRGARASITSGTKGRRENTLRFMGADGIPLPPQKLVVLKKAENCLGCTSAAAPTRYRDPQPQSRLLHPSLDTASLLSTGETRVVEELHRRSQPRERGKPRR